GRISPSKYSFRASANRSRRRYSSAVTRIPAVVDMSLSMAGQTGHNIARGSNGKSKALSLNPVLKDAANRAQESRNPRLLFGLSEVGFCTLGSTATHLTT